MAKRALIVDDSKTARQVLSSKLKKYGILVDTRESAAAAIDYLFEEAPDAIFMDYEMPGMDGFQALKVIKSNPNMAVIPVMMYTSKAGGLALSQARALGAVGVLPKQLEPQDLEDVLHSLHLMPDQESLVHGFRDEDLSDVVRVRRPDNVHPIHGSEVPKGGEIETVSLPLEGYQDSLPGSDALKRSMRREIAQSEERLQERLDKHFSELHAELFELEGHLDETAQQMRRMQMGSWLNILVTFVVLVALFYLFNSSTGNNLGMADKDWRDGVTDQLALQGEKLTLLSEQMIQGGAEGMTDQGAAALPLGLLEWAANQGTRFEYGEMPFNDQRALWLSELVEQLRQAGFQGTVELRAHYGNFCLKKTESGGLVLANPELDISQCLFAAEAKASETWRNDQSVAFANYLNVELARSGGEVEILLFNSGYSDPMVTYPAAYEVKYAGEWNKIAGLNQRVRVSLYPNQ
ncbi:MAG: response regulator [Candidatus Thiodiazotropha sp.]